MALCWSSVLPWTGNIITRVLGGATLDVVVVLVNGVAEQASTVVH